MELELLEEMEELDRMCVKLLEIVEEDICGICSCMRGSMLESYVESHEEAKARIKAIRKCLHVEQVDNCV